MTYAEKLRDPRWQKSRLRIFERDKFTCKLCGDTETELHVHHKAYNGNPWDAKDIDLITLCKYCHFIQEDINRTCKDAIITLVHKKRQENGSVCLFVFLYFDELKWVFFYTYSDREEIQYNYGISENVIKELNNFLFLPGSNKGRKQNKAK